jgi:hypothetical protein
MMKQRLVAVATGKQGSAQEAVLWNERKKMTTAVWR